MLSGEAANTSLYSLWCDPTWACTHDLPHLFEHANHYTTDVAFQAVTNHIGGIMVSVLTSSVVDLVFMSPLLLLTKNTVLMKQEQRLVGLESG
jgi:hypothetical protein